MADLRSRLREADRVLSPDLWPEIGARAERIGEPSPERSSSGVRRLLVAALAFGVFAASGALTWQALRPGFRPPASETPAPSGDPWAAYGEGWSELPAPPEVRQGATMAWAGDELLYWGGVRAGDKDYAPTSDGYAFDPVSGTWRSIPSSPVPGKFTRAVWTGTEVVFWGAGRGQDSGLASGIGLAFDPSTERWRELPPSPHQPSYGGVLVWTGNELIWWGGGKPGDPENSQGAAFDPESNTWRTIADAPIGLNLASGVWTGKELIVFGSLLNSRNIATTRYAVGAAYDPATDTWREIAPSELSPQASSAVWTGDRMVAWDYGFKAAEYFPDRDEWRQLPDVLGESGECYVDSAVIEGAVFAWDCGYAAILPPGGGRWEPVNGGVTEPTVAANDTQYPLYQSARLIPAGEVLAMAAVGITVGDKGTPCYGCPGAPTSFWVYRPPVTRAAAIGEARLYLAGDGEMWVVDPRTDAVSHLTLPQLSPGDAPYRIVQRGDELVLWGYKTYVLDPGGEVGPRVLVGDSSVFIPSSSPDRVWVGIADPASGGERRLAAVREVSIDGRITVPDTRPPQGRWPVAAVDSGLVFQMPGGELEVWDPVSDQVVRRLPGVFPIAASRDVLAWCGGDCDRLHLTDVATGHEVEIAPPPGASGFEAYGGAFSPDGNSIAVPVRTDPAPSSLEWRLGLVDVGSGTATTVPGTATSGAYVYVAWSSSGDDVFMSGQDPSGARTVLDHRIGTASARRLPIDVGDFFGMAAI